MQATKLVPDLHHLPYQECLKVLQLPMLYYRRRRGDMIAVYQLLRSGLDMDPHSFFEESRWQ